MGNAIIIAENTQDNTASIVCTAAVHHPLETGSKLYQVYFTTQRGEGTRRAIRLYKYLVVLFITQKSLNFRCVCVPPPTSSSSSSSPLRTAVAARARFVEKVGGEIYPVGCGVLSCVFRVFYVRTCCWTEPVVGPSGSVTGSSKIRTYLGVQKQQKNF